MKKYVYSLLALLFIFSTSFMAPEPWYLFETNEFSILFPQKVETESQLLDSELGKLPMKLTLYDASVDPEDDNMVYGFYSTVYPDSVISSENPEIIEKFFRGAIDGTVSNVKGELLSEKKISIDNFPGREIRVNFNGGQAIIVMRCYLVRNIMYIVQTITLTEKDANASALKFLNSFVLK
jgi:hypothetical protein